MLLDAPIRRLTRWLCLIVRFYQRTCWLMIVRSMLLSNGLLAYDCPIDASIKRLVGLSVLRSTGLEDR